MHVLGGRSLDDSIIFKCIVYIQHVAVSILSKQRHNEGSFFLLKLKVLHFLLVYGQTDIENN